MQRDEFIETTVDWLNRRVAPEGVTVDADTPLFERGVIDSLGILRLIAWTERAIGRRIDDREIRMDRFGSVRAMAVSFAEGGFTAKDFAGGFTESGSAAERPTAEGGCARCGGCAAARAGRCFRRAA